MLKLINGVGVLNPDIAIVGEAPGAEEEIQGKPFVGRSGQLIDRIMKELNINRYECYITNVVKVRPENNKTPTNDDIMIWQSYLWFELHKVNPKIILALGSIAYKALKDVFSVKITKDRGQVFKTSSGLSYIPTFHPAYCLRNPNETEKLKLDFRKAIKYVRREER